MQAVANKKFPNAGRSDQVESVFKEIVDEHNEMVQRLSEDSPATAEALNSESIYLSRAQVLVDVWKAVVADHALELRELGLS